MNENETLIELWVGSIAFAVLAIAVGVWFPAAKLAYVLGVLLGCVTSIILAKHMARSIERALDEGGNPARLMRVSALVRFGMAGIVLILAYYIPFINPIGTFIGIMGLKVAAYLQPFTHKILSSVLKKEEDVQQ